MNAFTDSNETLSFVVDRRETVLESHWETVVNKRRFGILMAIRIKSMMVCNIQQTKRNSIIKATEWINRFENWES
jgi:hypothetical protein